VVDKLGIIYGAFSNDTDASRVSEADVVISRDLKTGV
jgi:hypothetical protein